MAHEFTACEIFGTRYSSLGKRIETSLPRGEADNARTVISDLDIFQLCDHLAVELEDEEAELDYLIENRKQYYKKHSYMEKKAIGKANDGPVFVGDSLYRRSNGEKYTVQEDGSITNASGKTKLKAPDLDNFIHFFPKKGECKTRTPEEASRSAAKQREQARKEAAKTTEEEKQIVREHYLGELTDDDLLMELDRRGVSRLALASNEDLYQEIDRRGIVVHLTLEKASDLELAEECTKRGIISDISLIPTEALREEINRRMDSPQLITRKTAPIKVLNAFPDASLADELRRRGYTVTATKTVEI